MVNAVHSARLDGDFPIVLEMRRRGVENAGGGRADAVAALYRATRGRWTEAGSKAMTDTPIDAGDLVAAFLAEIGVETAFGVISIHNLPMLDAIARRNRIRFVPARGEAGAASMADAFARVSGRLGVLFTSTGPGAANAAGGLIEARIAGSPILHLTGQTARALIGRGRGPVHDVPDQLAMLRAVSKAAWRAESAETLLDTLARAAAEALTPPMGPVSVEIPIDVQKTALAALPGALDGLALPVPPAAEPDAAALEAAAERLAAARRPLLWLGAGAIDAGAAAARLADLGVAVVTSMHGRAILPEDHPMTLGAFNATPEVEAFYGTVDLMVIAGSRLRGHETRDGALALPERRVRIDIDPAADGRGYANDLFIRGDAARTLDALAEKLAGRMAVEPGFAGEIAALRARTAARFRDGLGAYAEVCDKLRAVVPRDAVWARDITLNNSTWGNRLYPIFGPRDNIYPVAAGIGLGMPLAIGAAVGAAPRKTVAMVGDGGFFLNLGEISTLAQEGLDLVLIVMNDRGYGVIRKIQDAHYGGRHAYDDLRGPDLAGLARATGLAHRLAKSAEELADAVAEALARGGPALVEVDMTAIGPFPNAALPPAIRPPGP